MTIYDANGNAFTHDGRQPLPVGYFTTNPLAAAPAPAPIPAPVPAQATGDFLGFISQRESEQWYKPTQQYTVTAENIKAGLQASVREHTSVYGTSMFIDVVMGNHKESVKVSGTVASAIREAGKSKDGVVTAIVDPGTIMFTQLSLTEQAIKENEKLPADKRVKNVMYRASFSWS